MNTDKYSNEFFWKNRVRFNERDKKIIPYLSLHERGFVQNDTPLFALVDKIRFIFIQSQPLAFPDCDRRKLLLAYFMAYYSAEQFLVTYHMFERDFNFKLFFETYNENKEGFKFFAGVNTDEELVECLRNVFDKIEKEIDLYEFKQRKPMPGEIKEVPLHDIPTSTYTSIPGPNGGIQVIELKGD